LEKIFKKRLTQLTEWIIIGLREEIREMIRRRTAVLVESMLEEKESLWTRMKNAETTMELDSLESEVADFNRRWIENGGDSGSGLTTGMIRKIIK
jgi:hypothetical protein